MFKRFRNIRIRPLVSHLIVTLGYPVARTIVAGSNRLQLFTDAMTIIAVILLIGGVVYGLVLHGDFDISGFVLKRGMRRGIRHPDMQDLREKPQSFDAYMAEKKEKREEAFNYPLFLGIVYILAAIFIAYVIL